MLECEPQAEFVPNADIDQVTSCHLETFCARLLEERNRLGLRQADLAEKAGVARTTYLNYETGERTATVPFLLGLLAAGVDVVYLLTGRREVGDVSTQESVLLHSFRAASPALQEALMQVVTAVAERKD